MAVKINSLEIENVKRVNAVYLEPSENGLTVIGGNNKQGKSSILDAIAWAVGGDNFRPSNPQNNDSELPPHIKVKLSNGLVVERKGKNSALKVTDPDGNKGGQQLLNEFIEQLALNLPKFLNANGKEKAQILLKIIGVGDTLLELDTKENALYDERHAVGMVADQKKKYALEMEEYPDAPDEIVSASELIKKQQEILVKNAENQRKRAKVNELKEKKKAVAEKGSALKAQLEEIKAKLEEARAEYHKVSEDLEIASKTAEELKDESTDELEKSIAEIDEINIKVRANIDKRKAEQEAKVYSDQYTTLTNEIEAVRKQKRDLLNGADLPLEELSVENGEITYKGERWDNMSGSEQLIVATAIVRKLNPECGFVLLDKLEQMDIDTLKEFGAWLEAEGLQAISTRVSKGEECSIIIEDGYVLDEEDTKAEKPKKTRAKKAEPKTEIKVNTDEEPDFDFEDLPDFLEDTEDDYD